MTGETRVMAEKEMKSEMSVRSILHTEEGVEWGIKIWDKFESERRDMRRRQNKQENVGQREENIWGMGTLE